MTAEELVAAARSLVTQDLPFPGAGETARRHQRLFEVGRQDLSLARLVEAHWDAVAILFESGRKPEQGCLYAVWASERPGRELKLEDHAGAFRVNGTKMFCSGAGLIDRALITTGSPDPQLVDLDLRRNFGSIQFDYSGWRTEAFHETKTATASFHDAEVDPADLIGMPGWYLQRAGFWHGACGPAACWAGGAAGLVDYAMEQSRRDPHTLAHLGAMHAWTWAVSAYLKLAGEEIDASPTNRERALVRALGVRHLVEQACTEILRRLPRAYGPHPLVAEEKIARRYHELDLYLRQSHAERDLEALGRAVLEAATG